MFSRRSHHSKFVQDDFHTRKMQSGHKLYSSTEQKSLRKIKSKSYIRLFLETSSIHGLNHFIASKRHPCEVFLWLSVVVLSFTGTVYLSRTTWSRYQSSPTVVSMERDMFAWNTTFPCITVCLDKKVDAEKLANYLKNSDEPDKSKLEKFIKALVNATFQTFDSIPEYDGISANDYMQLILDLAPDFKPGINIGATDIKLSLVPTITEMGLCYAVNSKVAIYNSPCVLGFHKPPGYLKAVGLLHSPPGVPSMCHQLFLPPDSNVQAMVCSGLNTFVVGVITAQRDRPCCLWAQYRLRLSRYRASNKRELVNTENKTLFVHPLDGEVFLLLQNISSSYIVYFHGPYEVPDISTKYHHSLENFYMKIYVTAVTVYTSAEAAKLRITQRRCRFPHENNLKHNSVYTYTLCRMECRLKLCLKYCGCVPHFYRKIRGERTCDVKGLHCLARHKDVLYKMRDESGKKIDCGCYPNCDDINYVIQSNTVHKWYLGTNLHWGIVTYPRMRYRRDIIFGFTDVLVAVGGMAGLFLGCSVLSFMEIIYFLTLRLFWYLKGH